MWKVYIMSLLAASTLLVQCKKDATDTPDLLMDTVITGTVELYDEYGKRVDVLPAVSVDAWLADSVGRQLGDAVSVALDSVGGYRFEQLTVGLYSLRFTAQGYGDFVKNNIRFDGQAGVQIPPVKLSTYAAGSVVINSIVLSERSTDLGGGASSIADIDRTVMFGGSSAEPFQLKVRYFFGLDSSVAQGNCVFSYVSGTVEGSSGGQDRQSTKFGMANLKTHFKDSTLIYVAAAVETAPSQAYQTGEYLYFPNIRFPLSNVQTIYYQLNENN